MFKKLLKPETPKEFSLVIYPDFKWEVKKAYVGPSGLRSYIPVEGGHGQARSESEAYNAAKEFITQLRFAEAAANEYNKRAKHFYL